MNRSLMRSIPDSTASAEFELIGKVKSDICGHSYGFIIPDDPKLPEIFVDADCMKKWMRKSNQTRLCKNTRVICKGFTRPGKNPKARNVAVYSD